MLRSCSSRLSPSTITMTGRSRSNSTRCTAARDANGCWICVPSKSVGKFRSKDGSFAIDPAGTLPSGQSFKGAGELKKVLLGKKDLFARSLSEKMLTYALGRGLEYYDRPAMDRIVAAVGQSDYRISTLVVEITKSDPFRMRRGKDEQK